MEFFYTSPHPFVPFMHLVNSPTSCPIKTLLQNELLQLGINNQMIAAMLTS